MNDIFKDEIREGWVSIYMDDILIHTDNNIAKHQEYVHQILQKLEENDLYLKPEKCAFEQKRIKFLGVILEEGTIQMDPSKIKGVANWPAPRTVKDIQAFLGFTGFYRYFVPNYSTIAWPLIDLIKKAMLFHWDSSQFKAFKTIKMLMCQKPILWQPHYRVPFFLTTDALVYSVGAILSQEGEPNPRCNGQCYAPLTILLSHAVLYLYSLTMCTTRPFLPDYDCLIGLMHYLDT